LLQFISTLNELNKLNQLNELNKLNKLYERYKPDIYRFVTYLNIFRSKSNKIV
jgi:hypothetical protein